MCLVIYMLFCSGRQAFPNLDLNSFLTLLELPLSPMTTEMFLTWQGRHIVSKSKEATGDPLKLGVSLSSLRRCLYLTSLVMPASAVICKKWLWILHTHTYSKYKNEIKYPVYHIVRELSYI